MDDITREQEDKIIATKSENKGFPLFKGNKRDIALANRIRWYWYKKIIENKTTAYLKPKADALIQDKKEAQWSIRNREQSAITLVQRDVFKCYY